MFPVLSLLFDDLEELLVTMTNGTRSGLLEAARARNLLTIKRSMSTRMAVPATLAATAAARIFVDTPCAERDEGPAALGGAPSGAWSPDDDPTKGDML